MDTVIELDHVIKKYGANVAVNDVSLQVNKGEIFGVVGPNGAGKTTLIEMIEGLRVADSGSVKVLGKDIRSQAEDIKRRIGVLLQSTSVPGNAKVKEILNVFSSFYDRTSDLNEINRFLGLQDKQNASFKSLSGGWKQRVSLALALINDPDIVFLDEPSMGLDPTARNQMWLMIKQLREAGRTIVVTTHYMEEAEELCDRVAVMSRGRLIALDTPERLIDLLGGAKRVSFQNTGQTSKKALAALSHVIHVEWEPDLIRLHSTDIDRTLQQLFRQADAENWMVSRLKLEETSMNEVFNELTSPLRREA
ncbi:ABC transporter ATP-binding protein [Paenibacillus sp. J2TS4]|uniref:ABC transporter ATP-binding protein n=1 Tax=Paenibacillus sp. J2TS4 TaxID=2807194 RepID=UPI001AFDC6BF|nr:ABC transporter ATP-binding protein [Paenibacillus sp. J2TS4]GIP32164.1 hypothetical protein J2TS4_13740 [Paenibacillus sp. J2TS4]